MMPPRRPVDLDERARTRGQIDRCSRKLKKIKENQVVGLSE